MVNFMLYMFYHNLKMDSVQKISVYLVYFFFSFSFFFYLFWGQRETEHERGRGRERGRHRIGNRLQALSQDRKSVV